MKYLPWITFVLGGIFLLLRQNTAEILVRNNTALEQRVVKAEQVVSRKMGQNRPTLSSRSGKSDRVLGEESAQEEWTLEELDLAALAETISGQRVGELPDFKKMIQIQKLLLEATAEELASLVEKIGGLEVPDHAKKDLLQQFIRQLAEKDPERALMLSFESPFISLEEDSWVFTRGFSGWVEEAPTAALAWYDKQLEAGIFEAKRLDGRSHIRAQFEATVLSRLLASDLSDALGRLQSFPAELRSEVFQQGYFLRKGEEGDQALAELIRQGLPEAEQQDAFKTFSHQLVRNGDYDSVEKFIDRITATSEERQAIASQAANRLFEQMGWRSQEPSAEQIEKVQEFLEKQAPEVSGQLTGEAVSRLGQNRESAGKGIEIIRDLYEKSPSDDLLIGFFKQGRFLQENKEAAIALAQKIQDSEARETALKKIQ